MIPIGVKQHSLLNFVLSVLLLLASTLALGEQTPDETLLRPGDNLFLSLPGEATLNIESQIKRNGTLFVPEVGEIQVKGLTLEQANQKIRLQLQDVIHDVSSFELQIKQRRLIITVLGYVKKPGTLNLDPGSTIQEAINAAEGLVPGAQLNRMQVRRNNEVLRFDYKYYLDSGDSSKLPILQPLDTLFIPASSLLGNVQTTFDPKTMTGAATGSQQDTQTITVMGRVNNPGQFDWTPELTLFDIFTMAGGAAERANLNELKIISQNDKGQTTTVFDMENLIENGGSLQNLPQIKPNDRIIVPANKVDNLQTHWLHLKTEDSIYVMGEVNSPGRYKFNEAMHFLDILAVAKGPNDKADIHNIRITHRRDNQSYVTHLDLGRYFETGNEVLLPQVKTGDVIYIPNRARSWLNENKESTIRVLGAVNVQGRYRFDRTMTILDLLAQAGGLAGGAESSNIIVVNAGCCDNPQVNKFDLVEFSETGNFNDLPPISAGDTVYVMHKDDSTWNRIVANIQETVSILSVLKILGGG